MGKPCSKGKQLTNSNWQAEVRFREPFYMSGFQLIDFAGNLPRVRRGKDGMGEPGRKRTEGARAKWRLNVRPVWLRLVLLCWNVLFTRPRAVLHRLEQPCPAAKQREVFLRRHGSSELMRQVRGCPHNRPGQASRMVCRGQSWSVARQRMFRCFK